jgi:hypothetical protein
MRGLSTARNGTVNMRDLWVVAAIPAVAATVKLIIATAAKVIYVLASERKDRPRVIAYLMGVHPRRRG